jgi:uncharacterized protein (DUF1778 family)
MNTQLEIIDLRIVSWELVMSSTQRKQSTARTTKVKTLNLRVTEEQKAAFEQAALIKQTNVSSFILDNAYLAAQELIRNQHVIQVSKDQWNAICRALDNPPETNPKLRKLLRSKSVFEKD